jgi:hypothetical protein
VNDERDIRAHDFPGLAALGVLICAAHLACCGYPDRPSGRELSVEPGCDPVGRACRALGERVELVLRIGPPAARTLQPFPVSVRVRGMTPEKVIAEFAMPDMNMGQNRYQLLRAAGGQWEGKVILPTCSAGRRDWVARVTASTRTAAVTARFPFRVEG